MLRTLRIYRNSQKVEEYQLSGEDLTPEQGIQSVMGGAVQKLSEREIGGSYSWNEVPNEEPSR